MSVLIFAKPKLKNPSLVLGLAGWMDGGFVSTGTISYLRRKLKAKKFAEISDQGFYILNFPGPMEFVGLFRPHTKIVDGLVEEIEVLRNDFYYVDDLNLILFSGREPNLNWEKYSDCIFEVIDTFGVKRIYFVGSVAGPVPHTREPKVYASVSTESLKEELHDYGIKFTRYQGPASFITLFIVKADERGIEMISFVVEIPFYITSQNPRAIESVIKRLMKALEIKIDLADLKRKERRMEKMLEEVIERDPEYAGLAQQIKKLEKLYDEERFKEIEAIRKLFEEKGFKF